MYILWLINSNLVNKAYDSLQDTLQAGKRKVQAETKNKHLHRRHPDKQIRFTKGDHLKSLAKACELDPIPTKLLKDNLDILLPTLTSIVCKSLSTGKFLDNLKEALL